MDNKKVISFKLQVISSLNMAASRVAIILVALFSTFFAKAQDTTSKKEVVDMATGMRSNGKIYVVVAVLCIILAGIFVYLINLDKKIGKLEKEANSK